VTVRKGSEKERGERSKGKGEVDKKGQAKIQTGRWSEKFKETEVREYGRGVVVNTGDINEEGREEKEQGEREVRKYREKMGEKRMGAEGGFFREGKRKTMRKGKSEKRERRNGGEEDEGGGGN
jgi:hypothetical protein